MRLGQVVSTNELIRLRAGWKASGKSVVFAGGRFDLLHPGHVRLLEQARGLGDVLVVGVTGNGSGATAAREIATPVAERAEILAALTAVDYAVDLSTAAWNDFVGELKPDVIIEGVTPEQMKFRGDDKKYPQSADSQLVKVPLEPGYSTASLFERIRQIQA